MINKQLGIKLSTLTLALILAGCGGGGSEGYYNNGGSNPSTGDNNTLPEAVVTNYHLLINSDKQKLVASGDTTIITVKLVDVNGGGVEGEPVTLSIEDTQKNGITIEGSSTITTDIYGNATFNLKLDPSNIENVNNLIESGVRLNTTFKDTSGKVTSQTKLLDVIESGSSADVASYHLNFSVNKPTLIVTGDNATVTVKAVDENGGGISGKAITLSIANTRVNTVTIDGPSTILSDTSGNAVFNITLPKPANESLTNLLINEGLTLNASVTDEKGVISKQSTQLNIVAAQVAQPIGNITFGKSGELSKNSEGTYYTENLSAYVVDSKGDALVNQKVTMSVRLLSAGEGYYVLKDELDRLRQADLLALDLALVRSPNKLSELNNELAQATTDQEKQKIQQQINQWQPSIIQGYRDALDKFKLPSRDRIYCPLMNITDVSIATGFVGSDGKVSSTFTYTTNNEGKFDFQVNYLRSYASWQQIEFNASTTVSGKTLNSPLVYKLGVLKNDFDSESSQPFDDSPYGSINCNFEPSWKGFITPYQ